MKHSQKKTSKIEAVDEEEDHNEPVPFMTCMGFKTLYYDYVCCFCTRFLKHSRWWLDYKKTLKMVASDMDRQMDLVKLIKRMRVQSMLLGMSINVKTLKVVSKRGEWKPLEEGMEFKDNDDLTLKDKMFMGITKRYMRIFAREEALLEL